MNTSTVSPAGEYASAITDATASAERALGEAQLPIHILLSAQFGELNENQEEMLGAAANALDQIAEELRTLRSLAEIDPENRSQGRQVVRVDDILRDLHPQLRDQATRAGVSLAINIEPGLPTVSGAMAKLRDAIRITLMDEIRYAVPGSSVTVDAHRSGNRILIGVCCGVARSATASLILARRLLGAQGATLEHNDDETTIAITPS